MLCLKINGSTCFSDWLKFNDSDDGLRLHHRSGSINFTYFPGSASNELIVLHESGNERNLGPHSLDNEVAYMKRNWSNAYVSYFVGSGGRVKQLAPAGQIQYGAGSLANQKPMRKSNWLERIMRRRLKRLCCLC